jgi:hypothetical protein
MYYHPLTPPLLGEMSTTLVQHGEEIEQILQWTPSSLVTVMIYDIVAEPSRTVHDEIITPREREDATTYCRQLQRVVGRGRGRARWCLFHAIRPEDTLVSLEMWYVQHYPVLDMLVLTGNHWNPLKIETVVPHLLGLALPCRDMGAVLVPHRVGERERCLDRQQRGISFFVSQIQLYPTPEWRYFVEVLGPHMITLTTVPLSARQLEFLETLGVCVQEYKGLEKTLENKIQQCLEWFGNVPFGFDILVHKNRRLFLEALMKK